MPGAKRDPSSFIQATISMVRRGRTPARDHRLDALQSGQNAKGAIELAAGRLRVDMRADKHRGQIGLGPFVARKRLATGSVDASRPIALPQRTSEPRAAISASEQCLAIDPAAALMRPTSGERHQPMPQSVAIDVAGEFPRTNAGAPGHYTPIDLKDHFAPVGSYACITQDRELYTMQVSAVLLTHIRRHSWIFSCTGKSALVTGASKGIGRATALTLAAEGCSVHLAARSADALEELRNEILAKHKVRGRSASRRSLEHAKHGCSRQCA